MKITKADGGRLIEADLIPIREIIARYLGRSAAKEAPNSVARFPLLKLDETQVVARTPLAVDDEGGD
ncbi:MAG: hypothetical protein LBT81_06000 [Helicobacteraceae bacterium]|jgi:hypothetical protein|nr:hypothetical protein [Helicobacteraceae bacterium]